MVGSKAENSLNSFFSKLNFFPDLSTEVKVSGSKLECIYPFSLKRVLFAQYSTETVYQQDPNVKRLDCLDFLDFDTLKSKFKDKEKVEKFIPRSQCLIQSTVAFPKPMNHRIIKTSVSYHYDEKSKRFIHISKPYRKNKEDIWGKQTKKEILINIKGDKKKIKIYDMFAYTATVIQALDENRTFFSQIMLLNAGGWAGNPNIMKKVIYDRAIELRKTMIRSMEKVPDDWNTIEDFKKMKKIDPDENQFDGMAKLLSCCFTE